MTNPNPDLNSFFKSQGKKKQKKSEKIKDNQLETKAGSAEDQNATASEQPNTFAKAKDFVIDSDDEGKNDEFMIDASGIKNFQDEEEKTRQNQIELAKAQGGWDIINQQQTADQQPGSTEVKKAEPKKPSVPRFIKGEKPVFTSRKGFNKNEFPDLGDFPTLDGKKMTGASTKADESVAKCNSAYIGTFSAPTASGPKPEEKPETKGKDVRFGGKPMFTNSRINKPKPIPLETDIHDKQNYDYSKFAVATATKRPLQEGESAEKTGEEGAEERPQPRPPQKMEERAKQRPQFKEFNMDAEVKPRVEAAEDEDGFMIVTESSKNRVKQPPRPAQSWRPEPPKQANNRFDFDNDGWNLA